MNYHWAISLWDPSDVVASLDFWDRLFQHKTFSSFRNHPTIIPENKTKGLILKYKHKILDKEFLAVILIRFNNKLIGWR